MAKETYYFSHDYNSRNDPKMQKLLMVHGQEGKGIFWDLVEMLYEEDGRLNIADIDSYAFALRSNSKTVESVIKNFGLFEFDEKNFWSPSILKRIKKRKLIIDNAKKSAKIRWKKVSEVCDRIPTALPAQSEGNAIKEIKGKESKGKEIVFTGTPEKIKNDLGWKEQFCMAKNIDMEQMNARLHDFFQRIELTDDLKSVSETKKHFLNWFNKNPPAPIRELKSHLPPELQKIPNEW